MGVITEGLWEQFTSTDEKVALEALALAFFLPRRQRMAGTSRKTPEGNANEPIHLTARVDPAIRTRDAQLAMS